MWMGDVIWTTDPGEKWITLYRVITQSDLLALCLKAEG
jgi:hypothetical protein